MFFFSFTWYKNKENEGQPESAGRWRQPAGHGCCREDSESGRRLKAPAVPPGLRSPRTDRAGCTRPTPGCNLRKESRRREKQGRRCEVRLEVHHVMRLRNVALFQRASSIGVNTRIIWVNGEPRLPELTKNTHT